MNAETTSTYIFMHIVVHHHKMFGDNLRFNLFLIYDIDINLTFKIFHFFPFYAISARKPRIKLPSCGCLCRTWHWRLVSSAEDSEFDRSNCETDRDDFAYAMPSNEDGQKAGTCLGHRHKRA